jgi:hypothetical protein
MPVVTLPGQPPPIEIDPDDPVARLVQQADTAYAERDADAMDTSYRRAVGLADRVELRSALAVDHVTRLVALERPGVALAHCGAYLDDATCQSVVPTLRLLRAEAYGGMGAHLDAARSAASAESGLLTDHQRARLARVSGLAAADRADGSEARRYLRHARELFRAAGDETSADVINDDLRLVALRAGNGSAASVVLNGPAPRTVADRLAQAAALRARCRYEAAYTVLHDADTPDLDPALRLPVLAELVRLLRLMRQDDRADAVTERLREAACHSPDSTAARTILRLLPPDASTETPDTVPALVLDAIAHARRLIGVGRLVDSERVLGTLTPATEAERASLHLAIGELAQANYLRLGSDIDDLKTACASLAQAEAVARRGGLREIQIMALRRLGHAYAQYAQQIRTPRDAVVLDDSASRCWSEAHRLDEQVVACQDSDDIRVGMLLSVPSEYDERIHAMTAATAARGDQHAPSVVIAMEAARGASILGVLGEDVAIARNLPAPTDLVGARRWLRGIARNLATSQAVWLIHLNTDYVHHAVVGRGMLAHFAQPISRKTFTEDVLDRFVTWRSPTLLEAGAANGTFDRLLAEASDRLAIATVLELLPRRVRRIAIVAGGALDDVPFAALPIPGSPDRLGHRYALTDLPCLTALRPLRRRSRRQRGDRSLLLRPPDGLATADPLGRKGDDLLAGPAATAGQLSTSLASHAYRQLRVDCHGKYVPEDTEPTGPSWLQLAPDGPAGRLVPDTLGDMDMRDCGTVMLGFCESGMAHRVGRDERVGFVRAALRAGAGAVIAARWAAENTTAAAVLDRFEGYLRYLPRDIALQRALLNQRTDHPARWGCWTLYGDPGWQTSGGPVRRITRRLFDRRNNHAGQR